MIYDISSVIQVQKQTRRMYLSSLITVSLNSAEIFAWSVIYPTRIPPHLFLISLLIIILERFDVLAIHQTRHFVRLPLFEGEPRAGVRVVLVIGLVFVILDLDKV